LRLPDARWHLPAAGLQGGTPVLGKAEGQGASRRLNYGKESLMASSLQGGSEVLYASNGARYDPSPAGDPELSHLNWREPSDHERGVVAEALAAEREKALEALGGLIR
jgi:hypothetical protein